MPETRRHSENILTLFKTLQPIFPGLFLHDNKPLSLKINKTVRILKRDDITSENALRYKVNDSKFLVMVTFPIVCV